MEPVGGYMEISPVFSEGLQELIRSQGVNVYTFMNVTRGRGDARPWVRCVTPQTSKQVQDTEQREITDMHGSA